MAFRGFSHWLIHCGWLDGNQAAAEATPEATPEVGRLLSVVSGELSRRELQSRLGLRDDDHMRVAYLLPALAAGVLERTIPDKPNSRLQKYRLTQAGHRLLQDQGEA